MKISKIYLLLIISFFQMLIFPQTDWVKWEKSEPSYQLQDDYLERKYDFKIESVSDLILKPVLNSYWFFISDVDGANCPFYPSCSSFFFQSVKYTNILQGTLMFFDRFTRDTNIIDRNEHYPFYDRVHFYDPVKLYTLKKAEIKFIPANTRVE